MTKLQAAMKDKSARSWRSRKTYYRVGSYFKGCRNCGEVEWVETGRGRLVKRYLSGYDVFRSYDPVFVGWTWWCWTCGCKDLACWEPDSNGVVEYELGKPPVQGTAESKEAQKDRRAARIFESTPKTPVEKSPEVESTISRLERQIAELKAMIAKGKNG